MQDFFSAVLPAQGFYRRVWLPLDGKPETTWAASLDEFVGLAASYSERERVYFGTASYITDDSGSATNVLLNKALRLDIDAGAEKFAKHGGEGVYETQQQALQALTVFIQATRLKPSFIVSSGAGLHVYYALAEPQAPDAWRALADRLYQLCTQHDIKVDHTTTCDITRLLRVPGALHENGNRVTILAGTRRCIEMDALDARLPQGPRFTADDLALTDEFLDDISGERVYPPASAFKIVEKCAALRTVADAEGDVPEPLWRAMIGLVKHTVEGDEQVHDWSVGYDGYDEHETQRKIDAWKLGPTTCDEFAKHCASCAGCPYRGKIKSPIQLGRLNDIEQAELPPEQQTTLVEPEPPAPTGDPWDGMLPGRASVEVVNGRPQLIFTVRKVSKDEDGNPVTNNIKVPITNRVFWFSQVGDAHGSDDTAQAVLCIPLGQGVKRYAVDQTSLAAEAELIKQLAKVGVHYTSHPLARNAAFQYAREQMQHIETVSRNLRVTDHFGMRTIDGSSELVAVHGRYTIHKDGVITDTMLSAPLRTAAKAYPLPVPRGHETHEMWPASVWDSSIVPAARQHVDFLNRHYGDPGMVPYQLAIMLMLASPMMPFVSGAYNGGELPIMSAFTFSLYSREGGHGKTAACQAGAISFGDPNTIVRGAGAQESTELARVARLSAAGTMPVVMDEIGSLGNQQTYNLLKTVANGSPRGRLHQDGSPSEQSKWSLINIATTNRSLREMLSSGDTDPGDSAQRRIMEIDVGDVPKHDADRRALFAREYGQVARDCAGALGAVLQREMVRIGLDALNEHGLASCDRADKFLGAGQADRFMFRAMGAMWATYALLKPLGLAPFNFRALIDEFKRNYQGTQQLLDTLNVFNSPMDTLARALRDLLPNTLVTDEMGDLRGNRAARVLNPDLRIPTVIKARHTDAPPRTLVQVDALREWCTANRVSEWEMVSAADAAGVLIRQRRGIREGKPYMARFGRQNLTAGIRGTTGVTTNVYKFDTAALEGRLHGGSVHEAVPTTEGS